MVSLVIGQSNGQSIAKSLDSYVRPRVGGKCDQPEFLYLEEPISLWELPGQIPDEARNDGPEVVLGKDRE